MLKVFADTQYKIVTCSPVAMRPNVQFNIVVSFHTNLLRAPQFKSRISWMGQRVAVKFPELSLSKKRKLW